MKLKAKIRHDWDLVVPKSPIWKFWSMSAQQTVDRKALVKHLEKLLQAGKKAVFFHTSWRENSVELSATQETDRLVIEYVFRLEFDSKGRVNFDIDLYGEIAVNAVGFANFNSQVDAGLGEFDDLVISLTNRLANRFKTRFTVEKVSRLVPFDTSDRTTSVKKRSGDQQYHVHYQPEHRTRGQWGVHSNDSAIDFYWENWLQQNPHAPVYDVSTDQSIENPYFSGNGGDFTGGGATGGWVEHRAYEAVPRDEAPHRASAPIFVYDPGPVSPTRESGWSSSPTQSENYESGGDSGDGGSDSGGGGGD